MGPECVQFLQWALPRLRLRWPGYRKVRGQVCKRVDRRLRELGLADVPAYRSFLDSHPAEWPVLDSLCRVAISRFYRDKGVFRRLETDVVPRAAQMAIARGDPDVRCWSAGCASGEEVYTLAILWKLAVAPRFPGLGIRILATDADPHAIERAREARYPPSSVKALPEDWLVQAFVPSAGGFSVKAEYREPVTFLRQDIREAAPADEFHLVLCRNLVLTYFDEGLQRDTLRRITDRLAPGGALVIGARESLPHGSPGLAPRSRTLGVYGKVAAG